MYYFKASHLLVGLVLCALPSSPFIVKCLQCLTFSKIFTVHLFPYSAIPFACANSTSELYEDILVVKVACSPIQCLSLNIKKVQVCNRSTLCKKSPPHHCSDDVSDAVTVGQEKTLLNLGQEKSAINSGEKPSTRTSQFFIFLVCTLFISLSDGWR